MSETIRQKAQAALAEVEKVTAVVLPEPKGELVTLQAADPATTTEIEKRVAEINIEDTNSIVSFGSSAQAELQEISQSMLAGVRNKDVGPAGDSLRNIVTTIRGFSISELDVRRERSWWEKLLGRAAPMAKFAAKFEQVQGQIDHITDDLLKHEHVLLKDIESLDMLYDKTLNFYDELALYIAAGEAKLKELDEKTIPAKEAEVAKAPEDKGVMKAQELRDMRAARDDLERRVHDLKLTRQVTMQSLPSIRLWTKRPTSGGAMASNCGCKISVGTETFSSSSRTSEVNVTSANCRAITGSFEHRICSNSCASSGRSSFCMTTGARYFAHSL